MSKTVAVTITLPIKLEKHVEEKTEYVSPEEFIRVSTFDLVLKRGFLSQKMLIRQFIALSKTKNKPFDEEGELEELRKTRDKVWKRRYGKSSS